MTVQRQGLLRNGETEKWELGRRRSITHRRQEDLHKRRVRCTRDLIADMRLRLSEADKTLPAQTEKRKAVR